MNMKVREGTWGRSLDYVAHEAGLNLGRTIPVYISRAIRQSRGGKRMKGLEIRLAIIG